MSRPPFLVLSLFVIGCASQQETLVGKPPAEDDAVAAKPRQIATEREEPPARPNYAPPAVSLETWPFVEERRTFELTWNGPGTVPLHEAPDPNSPILADVAWKAGERIRWEGTVVSVYAPSRLRATSDWPVEGAVYTTGYVTTRDYVSETIRAGQSVEVYAYAGARQCILGSRGKLFTAPCPPPDAFAGSFDGDDPAKWYQPARSVWWIKATVGLDTGWFPVDDRIAVTFAE